VKWINHQILTGTIVYAVSGSLLYAAYSMAGSVLPDKLEGNPREQKNYWSWRSRHRGTSHWTVPYLAGIAVLLAVSRRELATAAMWDLCQIGIFILVGAVLHIVEDSVCGKVPLLQKGKKIGISLFKVGSVTEYLFVLAAILFLLRGQWL
jgi:hypothetical protein